MQIVSNKDNLREMSNPFFLSFFFVGEGEGEGAGVVVN